MSPLAADPAEHTLGAWAQAARNLGIASQPSWMRHFRSDALALFEADGFPAPGEDAWRHMGLDALLKTAWKPAEDLSRMELPAGSGIEIKGWEDLGRLPEASATRAASGPFARLNAALLTRAISVRAPRNVCCLQPINFIPALPAKTASGWMIHPRASVLLEPGSRLDIVLDLSRLPDAEGLVNLVMDIELREQTALNLVIAGADTDRILSLIDISVPQRRDSVFRFFCLETRGRQDRVELSASLEGANASTDLFGLALLGEASRAFHHYRVDHRVPHTQSQQIFKSVLSGEARYEYDSLVTIHPEAPHCSSEQLNKNLVLSDAARAYARPQLAIHTDEVQCHHGATVGQMSTEELLYLRTRGVDPASASALILKGFVDDLLKEIPVSSAAAGLQRRAHERLSGIAR